MNSLGNLQRDFQTAVTGESARFVDQVQADSTEAAKKRVGIYIDAYSLRLTEALRENYPGVFHLLGEDEFNRICRSYIRAHPSTFRSIRSYGDHLAEFLASSPGDLEYAELLSEMALVDWHMAGAFDAADEIPIDESTLAAVPPDQWATLGFLFHPSIRSVDLHFNTMQYRKAVMEQADRPAFPTCLEHPIPWLIWRQDLSVRYRSMEVDEAWALNEARSGLMFSGICEGLSEWIEEQHVPMRAVAFLKRWLIDGLIVGFET